MSDVPSDPPWEPPLAGSEIEHLLGALNRQRWTFRWKADGLDAAGLELRVGSSALTLGGLAPSRSLRVPGSWQARSRTGRPTPVAGERRKAGRKRSMRRARHRRSCTHCTTVQWNGPARASPPRSTAAVLTKMCTRQHRTVSTRTCVGCYSTSWKSTPATPGTPTCCARPSMAASGRTRQTTGDRVDPLRLTRRGRRPGDCKQKVALGRIHRYETFTIAVSD